MKLMKISLGVTAIGLLLAQPLFAHDIMPPKDSFEAPKKEYSPYFDDRLPINVYFGDTHLHTSCYFEHDGIDREIWRLG